MQQIESIHANGEMEEVKEQKKLEKNPTMQQVLLHDSDFTLNIKMLNQYSNNYCIPPPPKTKTNVHHSLSKRSKHKLNFWICTFITVKKKKLSEIGMWI